MAHAVARDAFWDQAEEQEANTGGMTGRRPTACSMAARPRAEPQESSLRKRRRKPAPTRRPRASWRISPDNATWDKPQPLPDRRAQPTQGYTPRPRGPARQGQLDLGNHSTPRRSQGRHLRSTAPKRRKERPLPSTTPADTTKTKGTREDGMPAGHPLQRLARCTGHKGSDDAFWAIMDWKSEDEHKEKKAVQKTKKPKGNPPGQGTRHKEASHAAPFRARRASTSSSSIRAQAAA